MQQPPFRTVSLWRSHRRIPQNIPAAAVHAASWKAFHAFPFPQFIARHTPERQARYLRGETAASLVDHLFRSRNAHKVMAETEDTVCSLALMEKLGMRREGVFRQHCLGADGRWRDLYWYGLLRDEYWK